MEQSTALEINLFGEQLPSLEQLRALSHAINSSEFNRMKFAEQVEVHVNSTSADAALAVGGLAEVRHRTLAVDGHALMDQLGIEPGPEVGRILASLLEKEAARRPASARALAALLQQKPTEGVEGMVVGVEEVV